MENTKELPLTVEKTVIELGLEKEVRLLHVTDSHISKAYESEGADLCGLAVAREKYFDKGVPGQTVRLYEEAKVKGANVIKEEFSTNTDYYEIAEESAEIAISNLVYEVNQGVKDLKVTVEFY